MQKGMTIETLLTEVSRQTSVKNDFVSSTQDNIRLVPDPDQQGTPVLVMLQDGAHELQRFQISENAHRQIAGKLSIPFKHYNRLLVDYPALVLAEVNAMFQKEPTRNMIRVLDGSVRGFLSDRYRRLDNDEILKDLLPIIVKGEHKTQLLQSHVNEHQMTIKALFVGDEFAHEITKVRGESRIIRPGFRISNAETGGGSLKIEAFFYDGFCLNGCVWGQQEAFTYSRNHVGGRVIEGEAFEIMSDETRALQDKVIISEATDVLRAITKKENVDRMVNTLREKSHTPGVKNPEAAVDLAVKELGLNQRERASVLETFIRDQDYTQWGMASAITESANKPEVAGLVRVNELENIGGKLLQLSLQQWGQYVEAQAIPVAA